MSHRPIIIVVTVWPRVGLVTFTFKVKVIPRPNALNSSNVLKYIRSASTPCLSMSKQFGSHKLCCPKITKMLAKNSSFIGC